MQNTLELQCWGVPGDTVPGGKLVTNRVPRRVNPTFGDSLLCVVDPMQDAPMTQWMCAMCGTTHIHCHIYVRIASTLPSACVSIAGVV